MFIEKRKVIEPTGTKYCVPYCEDCHSQDVETIQTCKECGSHNIKSGYDLLSDNQYGVKIETREVTKHIYKCDVCGKEYDGLQVDNYLAYADGGFEPCNFTNFNDAEYTEYINYQLDKDLCDDCKRKLKTHLDMKLLNFVRPEHINELINNYLEGKCKQ